MTIKISLLSKKWGGIVGGVLGEIFKPGNGVTLSASAEAVKQGSMGLYEIIVNFVPTNIIEAMAEANMIQIIVFMFLFGVALSSIKEDKNVIKILGIITQFNKVVLKLVSMIMKLE